MIVLVTGSQDHDPIKVSAHVRKWILDHTDQRDRVIIMHGDAKGADRGAKIASEHPEWGEFRLPAQWSLIGKPAGARRNREMVKYLTPDAVLAYPLPDSRGTWDMVTHASALGIPVHVFEDIL